MLEQWAADRLLAVPKVYTYETTVDLGSGVDDDYQIESDDGLEFFLLDVRRSRRNAQKARFQLRYRQKIVLARLCTAVPHTNPDGEHLRPPHLHLYREEYDAKWAEQLDPFPDVTAALEYFCKRINAPSPDIQGGTT